MQSKLRIVLFSLVISLFCQAQEVLNFQHLSVKDGLAHNNIYDLFQDNDGYLWIGAGTKLQRYDGHNFVTFEYEFNNPNSLVFGDIMCIVQDHDGALWVGTDGGGLSKFHKGQFTTFKRKKGANSINNNSIETMIIMPDSSLLIGTWGGGINILKEGEFSSLRHNPNDSNSLSGNKITTLFYDSETEILWIGTWENGLCYLKDGHFRRFPVEDGSFNSRAATSITKTSDGSIWIGSWGNGIFKYNGGKFEQFTYESGHIGGNDVYSLEGVKDDLWIGSYGGGVTLYNNNRFTKLHNNEELGRGLYAEFIESSFVDQEGNYWVGTYGDGITKLASRKSNIRKTPTVEITHLSIADSIIFWNPREPNLAPWGENLFQVEPQEASLSIHFSDLELGSDSPTYFKHKLSGLNSSWTEASQISSATFQKLKPGKYSFDVMASKDQVEWSAPAQIKFEVHSTWYQTVLFKIAAVVFMVLIIVFMVRLRLRVLMRRSAKLKKLVNEKTREIHFKNHQISENAKLLKRTNDELRHAYEELKYFQKQNDVFIENEKSVTSREVHDNISIALFSARQRVDKALKTIEAQNAQEVRKEVGNMMKELIEDSQLILKNLSSRPLQHASFYDSLKDLLDNISPITKSRIHLDWQGDHRIEDLKIGSNLFRIIKEALSNSVKYSEAKNIRLSISNFDTINCIIEDDGKGFDSALRKSTNGGIQSIEERANDINADIEWKTQIGQGTRLTVALLKATLIS